MRVYRTVMAGLALAGVVIAAAPAGAPAAPVGPTPYLLDHYRFLTINSNARWKEPSGRSARQRMRKRGATSGSDAPWYVWGRRCTTAAQTVRLRRNVWLPGPPTVPYRAGRSRLDFFLEVAGIDRESRLLRGWDVRFNGDLAQRVRGRAVDRSGRPGDELALRDAAELRRGVNRIEVVVYKRRARCRTNLGARRVPFRGVYFSLRSLGSPFAADLGVGQGGPAFELFRAPTTTRLNVAFLAQNRGPSEADEAFLRISFSSASLRDLRATRIAGGIFSFPQGTILLEATGSDGAVQGCRLTGPPETDDLRCQWPDFAPGTSGNALFSVYFRPSSRAFTRVAVTLDVELAGGPGDPNLADNSRSVTWAFCGDLDRSAECAAAP